MIRKLVMLALVLGLALSAFAEWDVQWSSDGGSSWNTANTTDNISVSTNMLIALSTDTVGDALTDHGYFIMTTGTGEWTGSGAKTANATAGSSVTYLGIHDVSGMGHYFDDWDLDLTSSAVGIIATFEFHCRAAGDATMQVWNKGNLTRVDPTRLVVPQGVPEPMTIALLGLGGLFLRRRK